MKKNLNTSHFARVFSECIGNSFRHGEWMWTDS